MSDDQNQRSFLGNILDTGIKFIKEKTGFNEPMVDLDLGQEEASKLDPGPSPEPKSGYVPEGSPPPVTTGTSPKPVKLGEANQLKSPAIKVSSGAARQKMLSYQNQIIGSQKAIRRSRAIRIVAISLLTVGCIGFIFYVYGQKKAKIHRLLKKSQIKIESLLP